MLDAALAVATFMPDMRNQINDKISQLSGGTLTIEDVDTLLHKTLAKPEKSDNDYYY